MAAPSVVPGAGRPSPVRPAHRRPGSRPARRLRGRVDPAGPAAPARGTAGCRCPRTAPTAAAKYVHEAMTRIAEDLASRSQAAGTPPPTPPG